MKGLFDLYVYAALLAHYGAIADPARVRNPDRKGTVENAMRISADRDR
ncbi:MAG TPA: hypothetical protein VN259_06360 [Xanthomonadales bacterium]|nr:hypothetical protein [Xanthomonadales bacterium]